MEKSNYTSMYEIFKVNRRKFLKIGSFAGAGIVLGNPTAWAKDQEKRQPPEKPKTQLDHQG